MPYRFHENEENGQIVFEEASGRLRLELSRTDRWQALLRILVPSSDAGGWSVDSVATIVGGREPYAMARVRLLQASEGGQLSEVDVKALWDSMREILFSDRLLRSVANPGHMHYHLVAGFLGRILETDPQAPRQLRACFGYYHDLAGDYETNSSRYNFDFDLNFKDDWTYAMAIDLVNRHLKVEDAFCIIISAESTDSEFTSGFKLFRDQLDAISDEYVQFFVISDVNGKPSAEGKHALAKELDNIGIKVRADEAFFVALRLKELRSPNGEVAFEATSVGAISLAGKVTDSDVKPLLQSIVTLARKAKLEKKSFEQFQDELITQIAWVRASQRLSGLFGLFDKLQKAAQFVWSFGSK